MFIFQQDPMATPRGISVPVMENFMADVGDGCCLAVLLSFYCPQIVKLEGKNDSCSVINTTI